MEFSSGKDAGRCDKICFFTMLNEKKIYRKKLIL